MELGQLCVEGVWGTPPLDFAEFYRKSADECLRAVLVSVGDLDTAQDLVNEAQAWCGPASSAPVADQVHDRLLAHGQGA
jgi:hypothetical protein